MAILWTGKVFEGGISGTTTVYTGPDLYRRIAMGEKWSVQFRASQSSGTSPTLAIALDHSNSAADAASWSTKTAIVSATALTAGGVTYASGSDTGTANVGQAFMRLAMTLGGTSPSAYVEVWMTVRSND